MRGLLPFAFLIIPLIEIALFVTIGGQIGVLPTIALVLTTAVIGTTLLRHQGFGLINRVREKLDRGEVPGRDLAHGAMLLVAGVLLLTPGFFTDTLGFALFVPAVRDRLFALIAARMSGFTVATGPFNAEDMHSRGDGPTIELDPDEVSHDDAGAQGSADTPWRRP